MPVNRTYTGQELEQLLIASRQPTFGHHPGVGLLIAMALVLEHFYALDLPQADVETWMAETVVTFHRELLRGTAELLRGGVVVPTETVN